MAESKQSVCQCVNSTIDYINASPYPLSHLIKPACQTHPKPSFTNGKDGHLVFPASPPPSILLSLCIRLTSPVTGAQVHFAYCVFIRQADDVKYDENIASGYGCHVTPHFTWRFKLEKNPQQYEHRTDLKVLLFYLYWMKVKTLICCQRWNEKWMSGRYGRSGWSGERPFVFGPRLALWV